MLTTRIRLMKIQNEYIISMTWDAGDMGCGELIMLLAKKIKPLSQGAYFEIIARDVGGVEDLPAWARMTGNNLVFCEPPRYIFKRK